MLVVLDPAEYWYPTTKDQNWNQILLTNLCSDFVCYFDLDLQLRSLSDLDLYLYFQLVHQCLIIDQDCLYYFAQKKQCLFVVVVRNPLHFGKNY